MQRSVSIEDAWNEDVLQPHAPQVPHAPHAPQVSQHARAPPPPPPPPPPVPGDHHAAMEMGQPLPKHARRAHNEVAEQKLVVAIGALAKEMAELRHQMGQQNEFQNTVFYVAIGTIILLLVAVLQSFLKLQHASECMLWLFSKRPS